jgi:hypothetical protein
MMSKPVQRNERFHSIDLSIAGDGKCRLDTCGQVGLKYVPKSAVHFCVMLWNVPSTLNS